MAEDGLEDEVEKVVADNEQLEKENQELQARIES